MEILLRFYKWFLEFIGRPDFYYTDQLKYIARKRPWLFLVVGLPLFVFWFVKLIQAKNKTAWVAAGILIWIFTTWLLLHLGGYW